MSGNDEECLVNKSEGQHEKCDCVEELDVRGTNAKGESFHYEKKAEQSDAKEPTNCEETDGGSVQLYQYSFRFRGSIYRI